jgi:uncharacterized membrane protein (DUF373 family)
LRRRTASLFLGRPLTYNHPKSNDKRDDMSQDHFPEELSGINRFTIKAMVWLNGIAHIIIGLALAASVLMFTWLFWQDVWQAANAHNLIHGFLHALGTLMLLWIISALITAEIRYLRGNKLEVETFVEVALVVMVRRIIVMPVQDASPTVTELAMWVGGALLLALTFFIVRYAQNIGTNNNH